MLDSLNFDCIDLITKDLSFIDILSLKYTSKNFHSLKFNFLNFKDIFIKRLLEGNVVPNKEYALKFCENLYDTGAYVAGSFILDCLYNTNYHNDIDVYDQIVTKRNDRKICWFGHQDDQNLKFTQSLYDLNFESIWSFSEMELPLRNFINMNSPECSCIGYGREKEFGYDTIKSKNLIQIIPINLQLKDNERSVIPRFIKASFDLDICQNFFDGRKLYIKDIFKLIYRYDHIKPNTKFMLQVYETNKTYGNNVNDYGNGVNNINYGQYKTKITTSEHEEFHETKNTIERINKYINRGFNIGYHPKYDEIKLHIEETLENNKYCKVSSCPDIGNCTNKDHARDNIKCIADGSINLDIY